MLSPQDLQMFDGIARHHPSFRKWLQKELDKQTEILVVGVEEMQIRRAQGYVACLKQLIGFIDETLTSR